MYFCNLLFETKDPIAYRYTSNNGIITQILVLQFVDIPGHTPDQAIL